ncbi:MAG TPA: diacylglycerol kinase family protein [Fibrobacteria bacterium]|nr:diacylglycerol kinase family protein [Fibrobacteria bacterium]
MNTILPAGTRVKTRYAFLVNPVSGSGRGRDVHEQLPASLQSLGVPLDEVVIEKTTPGDVPAQARRLLGGCSRLVVAGGDGTIGQALEGLRHSGRMDAALGVVPLGTGNDLARELDLLKVFQRQGLSGLLALLLEDRIRPLDLWDVDGRAVMVNYLSFGVDGWITEVFGHSRNLSEGAHSTAGNKLRYVRAGIGSLARHLPADFSFRATLADGSILERSLGGRRAFVALNIASYASGLLHPMGTRCDDGLLTLFTFPRLWSYPALLSTAMVPSVQRWVLRRMPHWHASRLEVAWDGRNALQVDGEGRRDLMDRKRLEVVHWGRVQVLSGAGRR